VITWVLPLTCALKNPSQRVWIPPANVHAWPAGFWAPQALGRAKKASQWLNTC